MDTQLARYDAMVYAISECHKVDEVKDLRDKAMALEMYARQARNLDAERKAAEVRLRAERRAGELLKEQAANGQRAIPGANQHTRSSQHATTSLSGLGISKTQSSRWQALAEVPKHEFEAALRDPEKRPSTSGIVADHRTTPRMNEGALWFWGRLREFEQRGFFHRDISGVLDEMTDAMRDDCRRLIPLMAEFFNSCEEAIDG